MLIQKHILVFIFCNTLITTLKSQIPEITVTITPTEIKKQEDISRADALFRTIQTGFLLIKLPASSKKLQAIERELEKGTTKRLESLKEEEITSIRNIQKNLMEGFKKHYSYGKFVAVFDSNYTKALDNPSIKGIFLDENLKKMPDFSLENKKFATFREDNYFYDEYRGVDGFVVTDASGEVAKAPFPYGIPYKFKRFPLLPDSRGDMFGIGNAIRKTSKKRYYVRYSWRDLNDNPYHAIVMMLQLRIETLEIYLEYQASH
jgi:hypothetical protein